VRYFKDRPTVAQRSSGGRPPDMNPIEHVWPLVSRQLVGDVFASRDQLWDALVVAFGKISRLQILRLYDSMPRRLQALLDARGGPTRY
jgi:hypothetical protein